MKERRMTMRTPLARVRGLGAAGPAPRISGASA